MDDNSYKSTAFCDGNRGKCLKFDTCPIALTDEVKEAAAAWWAENKDPCGEAVSPILQIAAPKKLSCYEHPKEKENDVTTVVKEEDNDQPDR
jgi:dsDNA-binding SOS-regulon protein